MKFNTSIKKLKEFYLKNLNIINTYNFKELMNNYELKQDPFLRQDVYYMLHSINWFDPLIETAKKKYEIIKDIIQHQAANLNVNVDVFDFNYTPNKSHVFYEDVFYFNVSLCVDLKSPCFKHPVGYRYRKSNETYYYNGYNMRVPTIKNISVDLLSSKVPRISLKYYITQINNDIELIVMRSNNI